MCGLAGALLHRPTNPDFLSSTAHRMGKAISHRGPDANGIFIDSSLGVALSHQRLSILDLSSAGHQPMVSPSGRYVIAFNGEIYNHLSIRSQLQTLGLAPKWEGHSDTETFLAALDIWGIQKTLEHCDGMWAIAIIDRRELVLHLIRDRFGEKPLYWGSSGTGSELAFLFGSELSALKSYPFFSNHISQPALAEYLRFGYVPSPLSIYKGISKLEPGHILSIPLPFDPSSKLTSVSWWDYAECIQANSCNRFQDEEEALSALDHTLRSAISDQSHSDVPLGTFLSGGIDSSLVTALLQLQSHTPIRTFTIGFEETSFNEAHYARDVADYLGTDHAEVTLSSSDALSIIPELPTLYSEPFADSSQLPTHLVCREARRSELKVALSGDGGDELFGGYNRYLWGPRIWSKFSWIPPRLRRSLGKLILNVPPYIIDSLASPLDMSLVGHKAHKLASRLSFVSHHDDLYRSLIAEYNSASFLLQNPPLHMTDMGLPIPPTSIANDQQAKMMYFDALGYLPDDILVKVDRAAMSVGLETRSPFLNHHVASVAWRFPTHLKIKNNSTKYPLRTLLKQHLPSQLFERPKAGFAIPIAEWLRAPLRKWADDLLSPHRLLAEGFLNPEPISILWSQHLTGRFDHSSKLWTILMWQSWLEKYHSSTSL